MKKKTPTYNMTWQQIENIKKEAKTKAVREAFNMMIILPVMVLRDHYGFGNKRMEEFIDNVKEMYESYEHGYLSLEDMVQTIKEELNISINID